MNEEDDGDDEDGEQKPVPHTFIFTKRSSFLSGFRMILVSYGLSFHSFHLKA